jgi:thioesterase domain-containing protein
VHPVGGSVLAYKELGRLVGARRPLFGLQAAGLDGEREPEGRLEAMAARYVAAVLESRPAGAIDLAGWSMGGVVAYEMACQLSDRGRDVASLTLIDSRPPVAGARLPDDRELLAAFASDLALTAGKAPGRAPALPRAAGPTDWLEWLGAAEPEVVAAVGPERLGRLWEVYRANARALAGYAPRPYPGRLTLVLAGRRRFTDPTAGWGALARGGVAVRTIPGDHYSLLRPPAVGDLASAIGAGADEAHEHGTAPP